MDNFKFNFLSRGQLESLNLDKFLLIGVQNNNMPPGFSGNLIFAIFLECCAEIILNCSSDIMV